MGNEPPQANISTFDISFEGDEVWDCDDAGMAVTLPSIDSGAFETACGHVIMNMDWINCTEL